MDDNTRRYLEGRFKDYYRKSEVDLPPESFDREWGIVPWTKSPGEIFERHKALVDIGDIQKFLASNFPKHVYMSSSKYERPAARNMDSKKWKSADLVFDIDAKDISTVQNENLNYKQRLAEAKKELQKLIYFIENVLEFENLTAVFSGGQGYHLHVRDEEVQHLKGQQRTQIVNFIKGEGLNTDIFAERYANSKSIVDKYTAGESGWNGIVLDILQDLGSKLNDCDYPTEYITKNTDINNKDKAQEVVRVLKQNRNVIRARMLPRSDSIRSEFDGEEIIKSLLEIGARKSVEQRMSAIDEPVTTDVNRLIRLPRSLHGGTGFKVTPIPIDEIEEFNPLSDAIPELFTSHKIKVDVIEPSQVNYDSNIEVSEGENIVDENIGIYLMAQGIAEKLPE